MRPSTDFNISGPSIVRIARLFGISVGEAYQTYRRFLENNSFIPDDPQKARDLFTIELDQVIKEENLKRIQPYLADYSIETFYHLTHINNLPSILQRGILAKNELKQCEYCDISNQRIQRARKEKSACTLKDKTLHDFVPLFFAPNPPMLLHIPVKESTDSENSRPPREVNKTGEVIIH